MVETFTVETRGIGKPDYEKVVAGAKERRGIHLDYGQTLKTFGITFSILPSPFAWVSPPLIPGGIAHMIDVETGLPMPYAISQGYTLTVIAAAAALTEDAIGWGYFDGFLVECAGQAEGGTTYFENKLKGISSELFDPTGAAPHTIDITLTNQGLGNLQGSVDYLCILEAVGTPPLPKVKTVRCKWCGQESKVPNDTTYLKCTKCGELTIFYNIMNLRKTP